MLEREKILQKIQKCLSLSASSNEHEAAIALRQAQKLMAEYSISNNEILAAEASEKSTSAGAAVKPAHWETQLAATVAHAFGCRLMFVGGCSVIGVTGLWHFIGISANPEIATYAYQVMLRQAKRARNTYIKTALKRCKTSTKTRRADVFSNAWVSSVRSNVQAFANETEHDAVINAYIELHHPRTEKLQSNDRNSGKTFKQSDWKDYMNGQISGKEARLQRGVNSSEQIAIGHT